MFGGEALKEQCSPYHRQVFLSVFGITSLRVVARVSCSLCAHFARIMCVFREVSQTFRMCCVGPFRTSNVVSMLCVLCMCCAFDICTLAAFRRGQQHQLAGFKLNLPTTWID